MILSICILSYNTRDLTLACLFSLKKYYAEQLTSGLVEIIVVDNASTDSSVEKIKHDFPKVVLIENKENVGFSKGHNIATKSAKGKYIFFLNSDTKVKDGNFLEMVSYLEKNPHIGMLGAKLLNPNGSAQLSTGKFYTLLTSIGMLIGLDRLQFFRSSPKQIFEVDWVMGAAMLVSKKLFNEVGGFDEHFFMYVEDMELCFRIRKKGYRVVFYPEAKIVHQEHGSSNRSFAIVNIYDGILYFFKKHKSFTEYVIIKTAFMLKAIFAVTIGIATLNKSLIFTYKKILLSK